MLTERVAGSILRYNMFERGDRVGVAVSGGADSVCLLYVLRELAPRWALSLHVVHLDHQLRGEESKHDAEFVAKLARQFGFTFHLERVDVAESVRENGGNLEQAAREARLGYFRCLRAQGIVDKIALGHTRSDQAETVLFRFLRGAGTAGLSGIRPVTTEGVVRPLLELTREQVRCWLTEKGISWREDSSNLDRRFARNRIRRDLLPQLQREWNPALDELLAQTAEWSLDEEKYWKEQIDRLLPYFFVERENAILFRVPDLIGQHPALRRRLLRAGITRVKGDLRRIDYSHVAAMLRLCEADEGDGRLQVPGLDVLRSFEWVRLALPVQGRRVGFEIPLAAPGDTAIPGQNRLLTLAFRSGFDACDSVYNETGRGELDWDRLGGPLILRSWRPGDKYCPAGSCKVLKLKELFQSARVPLWERQEWPIITCEVELVWTRRFGVAASFAAGPGSRRILSVGEVEVTGR